MSIPNTGKRKVRPTHPGEMLREDFLPDYALTVSGFAKALCLSRLFGTSPEFWLNAQGAVDLWEDIRVAEEEPKAGKSIPQSKIKDELTGPTGSRRPLDR